MPTQTPTIMLSSTFYDLRHVREAMRHFIQDDLGYRPLLSEHHTFPIDPDLTTVENCRQRVEREADVLVLIIGRRYGSLDKASGKSVTNLEYLAARQKGIPIFAFAEAGLLQLLPMWRVNPQANFSGEVDTTELFSFLEQVRTIDSTWTQEFQSAQDLIDALRIQLAFQQHRGLHLQMRLRGFPEVAWLNEAGARTIKFGLEQPKAWEYLFFGSAIIDAIGRHRRLRERHRLGLPMGPGEDILSPVPWLGARFSDAQRLTHAINILFSTGLQTALGPPGTPGDPEALWFTADTLGDLYRDALVWAARLRTANIDDRFRPLFNIVAGMMDDLLIQVEEFGPRILRDVDAALLAPETTEPRVLTVMMTITLPQPTLEAFDREIARLKAGQDDHEDDGDEED